MPPEVLKDEYLYQPYDLLPPVGEALMTHLFHHPDHADTHAITCLRAPKKLHNQLRVCPRQGVGVGWGIHLVEGWLLNRVWSVALLVFLVGSLVFGICWATIRHDVQGAFGVSAWIVALVALVVGTIQAHVGS
jgi:hypothetical protein